jgi:hypothetical protein
MKCRFPLSYRELEEMMIMRGASVDHSTLQRWVRRLTRLIDKRVRCHKKPVNGSWRTFEIHDKSLFLNSIYFNLTKTYKICDRTVKIGVNILNRMKSLGMPKSRSVA